MARPRLLILGTGFAAFSLLRRIDERAYDVAVVSPRNHFLFTPLLPSTTVGTVEFRTIIEPIRTKRRRAKFHLGKAAEFDFANRHVACQSLEGDVVWKQPYDVLALAVGCTTNTFGTPGVAEHACFLKEVEDARRIRQRLVENLERASLPGVAAEEQARLLHFVAVGAGPTGVRFAAELHDLLAKDLPRSYPHLIDKVRVTLLDAGPSLLTAYDEKLRAYVREVFARRGVEVRTQSPVQEVGPQSVRLASGEELPCGMVLWCAGFARHPLIAKLDLEKDRAGRLLTDDRLQVLGQPDVYALGDCACPQGQPLPQLAQVAERQGRYLADSLNRRARGKPTAPFRWKSRGVSSYIGGSEAVVESPGGAGQHSGFWAYQQWRTSMWSQLFAVRSKILVPLDRLRAAVFGREISKL